MTGKRALVAFGGNALIKSGQAGHQKQQIENAKEAAEMVVRLVEQGYQPIVVHGNGPQVGNVLIQQEEAGNRVPPYTMDICGAQTQGSMGYMLQRTIENLLHMKGLDQPVAAVLTEVVVDRNDPGFRAPSKPVGPYYEAFRAEQLEAEKGWSVKEDAGRGWRRLVPSPKPREIVQLPVIQRLVEAGVIVIACGGGGVPVVRDQQGYLIGVEAVIDKDRTSAMLAQHLNVDALIVLTGVDKVFLDFGKPSQRAVDTLRVSEARTHLADGQFPPGSMGPKIEAAVDFVAAGGNQVLITTAEALLSQPIESVGTRIVPD
ncbi:carbamate kinase [Acanthopleuribacter pedis]|uniref:Carbamate kinase n=1 Tax=Acanthopleuribacter pedis TaxID=442870 RepID=A0A8J7QHT4_9BACT|nr:carbamate kinase [Acanthopleuribacter pedis]MBO1318730.1 carbamate kinase [Acanthopleuribacter pedis]